MAMDSDVEELLARFVLPPQDLPSLSFCGSKPSRVREWGENLPATNVGATSVALYRALPELVRLSCSPDVRLEMLEALRPYVQQCIEGLSRQFLNQPLILSDSAIKAATVAQALQKHMSNAYTVCCREFYLAKKLDPVALATSLHRALTGIGLMLMRSYQLYTPVRSQLWYEYYGLYLLAEHAGLLGATVADSLLKKSQRCSVEQAAIRPLLLACVRPNQLRQQEVQAVYDALEEWSALSKLVPAGAIAADNLHLVCLGENFPPLYKTRYKGAIDDSVRELDNSALLNHLRNLGSGGGSLPFAISTILLEQLISAWDLPALRSFERLPLHTELEACVGMSSVVGHIAGLSDADNFKQQSAAASEFSAHGLMGSEDPWDESIEVRERTMDEHKLISLDIGAPEAPKVVPHQQLYTVATLDASPGGYCLNWCGDIPALARVGELIGLKEARRKKWNVGVIRWVRQAGDGTQMGVQLLAPMAEAVELAMINKAGEDGHFMRALLLPALKAASQQSTLLTPSLPFREHSKVWLCRRSGKSKLQLMRKLFATGSISQFDFRELEVPVQTEAPDPSARFDESW